VQNVSRRRPTELEASGIRAVSVQLLATGYSIELAQDELDVRPLPGFRHLPG
jgi:hypothetical protein